MREYKFRGLDSEISIWRYGCLSRIKFGDGFSSAIEFYNKEGHYCKYWVKPETVGQYTGLKDKAGREIFERDIVVFTYSTYTFKECSLNKSSIGSFLWSEYFASFYINSGEDKHFMNKKKTLDSLEIIGNIHENPGLLIEEEVKE